MRNLILGIVAVCCVQLCFQLYMGVERTDAEYARMPAVGGFSSYDETIADIPDTTTYEFATVSTRPNVPQRVHLRRLITDRAIAVPAIAKKPVTHLVAPTTILIARSTQPAIHRTEHPAVVPNPVITNLVAREERRPEQKSLIAKALPVIKKPYDWVKSVGSLFR